MATHGNGRPTSGQHGDQGFWLSNILKVISLLRTLSRCRLGIGNRRDTATKPPGSVHESPTTSHYRLKDRLGPVFERFLDLVEELVGDGAVHHAVVVAQGDIAHRADGDGVVDDHRALFDGPETEDAHVGLADHRQPEQAAEYARVGDGEGALLDFFGLELFRAGALGEVVHVALDAEDVFLVGVFHHWDEQAPVERDGDADVDFLVQDHVGAVERR